LDLYGDIRLAYQGLGPPQWPQILIGWRDILIERVRGRSLRLTEKSVSSIETEGKNALHWIVDEKELISRTIYGLYRWRKGK
jgi:hypothetical protein